MKKTIIPLGISLCMLAIMGCSNRSNNENTTDMYDTLYQNNPSDMDTLMQDTLSQDSLIPPTPMN
ncbi:MULTISPECIES: hypothetical protein [Sphingobacterium]|uniref:hypothetical protein n=1 Tax=Sphingobacterium TaxID=28453 RepID=UPI0012E09A07|nr:hypothetical protein [Sphingobacterium sp. T2]